MRVLVTGHDGYLGAVLVPLLLERDHEAVGLDSGLFADCVFPAGAAPTAIPELRCDLRDIEPDDLAGFDAVVHFAALSNDPLGNLDPALTTDINYTGALRLAELSKAAGVRRFLFSSSCSTYGAAGDELLDESAAFNPVTPYALEKVRLEQALAGLADQDFSPTYLRNATAYGLSPKLRLDLVLNNLVGWAVTTGRVLLLSDGTPWRPIVHVEDIARAFLCVLEAPRERIHDQAFNVGRSAHNYRIRELGEIVVETVPGSQLTIAPGAGPDKRSYRVDFGKLEGAFPAWQPRWDARLAAQELYDAYRAAGLVQADLEGPRYIRLRQLERLRERGEVDEHLRFRPATTAAAAPALVGPRP
ncbi:MAG TPA: SDR family oxidoreductase [Thermoanaerobaculia bacterium]|nr:SDR family oxidoreductase [Thermoanaerobaculia bacterium]